MRSFIEIVGLLAHIILLFAGLLMFAGILPVSKKVHAKDSVNRQVGKGLLVQYGANLAFLLAKNYASNWNGWLVFFLDVLFILAMFVGLRIFLAAMKKINMTLSQEIHQTKP